MKECTEKLNQKAREDLIKLGVPEDALTAPLPFLLLYSKLSKEIKLLESTVNIRISKETLIESLANNQWKLLAIAGDDDFYTDALERHHAHLNNDSCFTIGHFAAWSGNPKALDWVKTRKPEILDETDKYGRNITYHTALSGNLKALDWIKTHKLEMLDARDLYGHTIAHFIAWSGNPEALDWVKKHKSELLDVRDIDGSTITHYAAWSGNPKALDWVRTHKFEMLDARENYGRTIAHFAAWSGNPEALDWVKRHDSELLDARNNYGNTIAHLAAWSGNPEALDWVRTHKPEMLDARGKLGRTIAHYAAWSGNPKALDWVRTHKFEMLDARDNYCRTIMFYAALSNNPEAFNNASGITDTPHSLSYEDKNLLKVPFNLISAALEKNYELGHLKTANEIPAEFKDNIISKLDRNRTIGKRKNSFMAFMQGVLSFRLLPDEQSVFLFRLLPDELCKHIFLQLIADCGFGSSRDFGFHGLYNEAKAFVDPAVKRFAFNLCDTKERYQQVSGKWSFFKSEKDKREQIGLKKHVLELTDAIKTNTITIQDSDESRKLIAFENPKNYDLESILLLVTQFFDKTWLITLFIPIVGQFYMGARAANGWEDLVVEDSSNPKTTALRWNFFSDDAKTWVDSQDKQPLLNSSGCHAGRYLKQRAEPSWLSFRRVPS